MLNKQLPIRGLIIFIFHVFWVTYLSAQDIEVSPKGDFTMKRLSDIENDSVGIDAFKQELSALLESDLEASTSLLKNTLKYLDRSVGQKSLLHQNRYWFLWKRGYLLTELNRFEESKTFYEKAIKAIDQTNSTQIQKLRIENLKNFKGEDSLLIRELVQFIGTLDTANSEEDRVYYVVARYNLASSYNRLDQRSKGTEILTKLLSFPYPKAIKDYQYAILHVLSINLSKVGNYDLAKKHLLYGINQQSLPDRRKAMLLVKLAKNFKEQMMYDSVFHYANLIGNLKQVDPDSRARLDMVLGQVAIEKKQFNIAESYFISSLKHTSGTNDSLLMLDIQMQMADVYTKTGKFGRAEAIYLFCKAYMSRNPTIFNLSDRAWLMEMDLQNKIAKEGRKVMYKEFTSYVSLRDTIEKVNFERKINEISQKYEIERTTSENKQLKKNVAIQNERYRNQRYNIMLLSCIAFLFFAMSFILYRQGQQRKRINRTLENQKNQIESLNQELSHRVKNNLAFVSGLMQMQLREAEGTEAKEAMRESKSRIEAMSLLHRKLHMQEDAQPIYLSEYLEEICTYLKSVYCDPSLNPTIELKVDNSQVSGEDALRIGLIINELVVNSFKHAFKDTLNPKIEINFSEKGDSLYTLTYIDNGKGFVANEIEKNASSMGMRLLQMLSKQLNGGLQIKNKKGAFVQIEFNELENL